ncbi:hypothetical protein [Aestuariicoccus sp. MJ-SS9]|uniref:hypothetical protein n=1 Tax=Aestuariicoccus sp. MJ-SS9 TaxID=3079855 RepID=UPI00290E7040|nr:hypothetical protein [Aestuariicoccus sp. MJ-SS9]MDU8911365.1 hypothetical protein [Aestuariicoccus sp. MJ-SS9]
MACFALVFATVADAQTARLSQAFDACAKLAAEAASSGAEGFAEADVQTFHDRVTRFRLCEDAGCRCAMTGLSPEHTDRALIWSEVAPEVALWMNEEIADDRALGSLQTDDGLFMLLRRNDGDVTMVAIAGPVGALKTTWLERVRVSRVTDPETFFFLTQSPEPSLLSDRLEN